MIDDGLVQKYSDSLAFFKQNLAQIFTHKLKTPLNAAIGYLSAAS